MGMKAFGDKVTETGDVWERDGAQRRVERVQDWEGVAVADTGKDHSYVVWIRPGVKNAKPRKIWCATWAEWVSKATRVSVAKS